MIKLDSETVMSLADAVSHLPKRRGGKRPHVATLYRWAQQGVRGVKLEVIRVGGTMCTSLEALQRFCDRLSGNTSPQSRLTRERQCQIKDAERQLAAAGIS